MNKLFQEIQVKKNSMMEKYDQAIINYGVTSLNIFTDPLTQNFYKIFQVFFIMLKCVVRIIILPTW